MATGLSQSEVQTTDGSTDAKQTLINNLFVGAVVGILRASSVIRPDDQPTHPAVAQSIEAFNTYLGFEWYPTMQVSDAVVGFEQWLAESGYRYEAPVLYTISNLTVTATMQTQSGQLSVAMQIYPTDGNELPDVIRAAKGELQDAIGRAFSGTQAPPLPETTRQPASTEFANVKSIKVAVRDGRTEYRMMPASGRWIQFGVALYPDKRAEFQIPDMMPGEYPFQGTMEIELKSDGKPARVVSIRR